MSHSQLTKFFEKTKSSIHDKISISQWDEEHETEKRLEEKKKSKKHKKHIKLINASNKNDNVIVYIFK